MTHQSVLILILFIVILLFFVWSNSYQQQQSQQQPRFTSKSALYIINMARKRDRCYKLIEMLKMPNFITLVNAVDGEHITEQEKNMVNTELRRGEVGCFASHMMVLRNIVDQSIPIALILEDDTRMELPEDLDKLNTYISATPSDWDVLSFSDGANKKIVRDINEKIIVPANGLWNAHVYMVTLKGARKLVQRYDRKGLSAPYDVWLYDNYDGLKVYCSRDAPFNREDVGSETRAIQ